MSLIPINLAIEDELSEVVLLKLLASSNRYAVGSCFRRGGYGYLKKTIEGWNKAAKSIPFVVLTDLDKSACPTALLENWLPGPRNSNLLFRVAVKEVESWLLADRVNLSSFLKIPDLPLPENSDLLPNPKKTLVELAKKSKIRAIRESLTPRNNSTAQQGPEYNSCLGRFVRDHWDSKLASQNSPSLARTINRFAIFTPVWEE